MRRQTGIFISGVVAFWTVVIGINLYKGHQNSEVDTDEYSKLQCNAHSVSLKSYLKYAFQDGKITVKESKVFWRYWKAQYQDSLREENEKKRQKGLEKFKKELDDCKDCYEWIGEGEE